MKHAADMPPAPSGQRVMPAPVRYPLLLVPAALGASSIATLLLYFYGVAELGGSVRVLLLPSTVALVALTIWARRTGRQELYDRIMGGLWAGLVASLAYDVARVPISHAGIPVFRAISYFGTVFLGQSKPTLASEVVGWVYHLSNGVAFGLMYATLFSRPRWWTAVGWGVFLELTMLYTPYAEVFGYQRTTTFFAITMGAHVCYGLGLWLALRAWVARDDFGASSASKRPGFAFVSGLAAVVIGAIAADSHALYAPTIPPSPPSYLGKHLYTTWDSLEPDRLAVMWVYQRFVDPDARFHFVRPFSPTPDRKMFGTAFDTPESEVRRTGTQSATEKLIVDRGLDKDPRLALVARLGHAWEITPWAYATAVEGRDLSLRMFGHEGAGVVEEVGPEVRSLAPGDHVIPLYIPECRSCKFCLSGKTNLCGALLATQGKGLMPDGTSRLSHRGRTLHHYMGTSTFAEYTVVPEIALAKIRPDAPLDKVCLLGCGVTTGVGAVLNTARVQPGATVAVFGLGGIGLSVIQGAVLAGAERIIGVDLNPRKFAMARQLGATDCLDATRVPNVAEAVIEMTGGGVDFSFECIGNVEVMGQALACTHKGWGQSIVIGVAGRRPGSHIPPLLPLPRPHI